MAIIDIRSFPSKSFMTFQPLSSIKSHKLTSICQPIQGDTYGHVNVRVITYECTLCLS